MRLPEAVLAFTYCNKHPVRSTEKPGLILAPGFRGFSPWLVGAIDCGTELRNCGRKLLTSWELGSGVGWGYMRSCNASGKLTSSLIDPSSLISNRL